MKNTTWILNLIAEKIYTKTIKYSLDIGALVVSCVVSQWVVFGDYTVSINGALEIVSASLLFFITAHVLGIYNNIWRFTSIHHILDVGQWTFLMSLIVGGLLCLLKLYTVHQSLLFTAFLFFISTGLLGLNRLLSRIIFENAHDPSLKEKQDVLLIGAGKGAEFFIRELKKKRSPENYEIKGILDDDPSLFGRRLFDIKIYGSLRDLENFVQAHQIKMIVVAIPSISLKKLANLIERAKNLDVLIRVLPSFEKMLAYNSSVPEDISLEDLLGRDSVHLDKDEAAQCITGKTILVTGAGGSIGSEICRQIINLNPKKLIIVDHSEYNLYAISLELENTMDFKNFEAILANVSQKVAMEDVFSRYKPDVVFHAAAYKHVPLLENQERQAVTNNFFGTKVVAELAAQYKAQKFVLVSTDKAVNPTNIMGSTKRMAEIFCQHFNDQVDTNYVTVRFGNVLGSAGSVIPLFMKQLREGGPLTVTHKDITRFFMSIPEASQLVLQAGAMGQGGEIFVLDMGQPVKISDLAERLITLTGRRPYKDIDITYTGLRPGEKLYEELFYENEGHLATKNKKIFLASAQRTDFDVFLEQTRSLFDNISVLTNTQIRSIIKTIVPEANI